MTRGTKPDSLHVGEALLKARYTLGQRLAAVSKKVIPMTGKSKKPSWRASPPALLRDEQPLLRVLVAQAARRGETLASLAKALGVSYERLSQWRRGEAKISRAGRPVLDKAANYLRLPTVLVLALSGGLSVHDFVWPAKGTLRERVGLELERLRQDPLIGAFVPSELDKAGPAVQLFVAFLYHQLSPGEPCNGANYQWLIALHDAAAGHAEAHAKLEVLNQSAAKRTDLF